MTIEITLTTIGADTGPNFDLYANVLGWTAVAVDVPGALLLAGYTVTVPDDTTVIRVRSHENNLCQNYVDIPVMVGAAQVYFDHLDIDSAVMGINNPILGATYNITFSYHLEAYVDNTLNETEWNSALTAFDISIDGGLNWISYAAVVAAVSGGIMRSDSVSEDGTQDILGISDISNVRVRILKSCGTNSVGVLTGSGEIVISSITSSTGLAYIICNDKYESTCDELVDAYNINCTLP